METWDDIPGYPGYQLSSELRVRSFRKRGGIDFNQEPRIMTCSVKSDGYPSVTLYRDGKGQPVRLHQIVAAVHLGPTPEGMEIRHFDDIKTNNRPENLLFGTFQQNRDDMVRNGKVAKGVDNGFSRLVEDDIRGIRILDEAGMTQRWIGKLFGLCQRQVSNIIHRRQWAHVV